MTELALSRIVSGMFLFSRDLISFTRDPGEDPSPALQRFASTAGFLAQVRALTPAVSLSSFDGALEIVEHLFLGACKEAVRVTMARTIAAVEGKISQGTRGSFSN